MLFFENRKDFGGIILDYKGIKCPVCEKPFTENDDIVVCPTCGAPYHRACYMEKGECIFTDLHEAGKGWAPPPPPNAPDISSEIKDKECPNCGTLNAHSALFCSICNASLTGTPETHRNSAYSTPPAGSGPNRVPGQGAYPPPPPMSGAYHGFGGMPIAFDPMGGANPTEPIAENVTYGDVSKLVQQNSGYYMAVFKNTNTYGRSKFNFSAFLFSGGWFLYRKQYKPGIILTAIMFLLLIGSSLVSYLIVNPIMIDALDTVGISYNDATYLQLIDALTQYFSANPGAVPAVLPAAADLRADARHHDLFRHPRQPHVYEALRPHGAGDQAHEPERERRCGGPIPPRGGRQHRGGLLPARLLPDHAVDPALLHLTFGKHSVGIENFLTNRPRSCIIECTKI